MSFNTNEEEIFVFLDKHSIKYDRFDHEPVFSVEEADKLPPMPGVPTKNLFLRDKSGKRHFLFTAHHHTSINLKELAQKIDCTKLSFGSPERLWEHFKVKPGSVTLLALMHDLDHKVEVFLDKEVFEGEAIQCHPLRNDCTFVLSRESIRKFLEITGHKIRVLE